MAKDLRLQILLAVVGVDQVFVGVTRDGVDRQVAPRQILFQAHVACGMHHKAFVAGRGFALGACQRVLLAGRGVQEHGEVFAHRCEAFGHHLFGRAAHHHPIAI